MLFMNEILPFILRYFGLKQYINNTNGNKIKKKKKKMIKTKGGLQSGSQKQTLDHPSPVLTPPKP